MNTYDKIEIREQLNIEDIFLLLEEWGGDPEYTSFGIISSTICHNLPGVGSRKLYYYENSTLFKCYTDCEESSFDIYELLLKVARIQWNKALDLNEAVRWIANKFGIASSYIDDEYNDQLIDWKILDTYDRIQSYELKTNDILLKEYDEEILNRFNYKVKISPWIEEGISEEALAQAQIGFYAGGNQITIPHYDKDGRFIGLRGRTLVEQEAERYGKYRPLKINNILYSHPLGMNLYNFNFSKDNIHSMKKAIVFESEKSTLQFKSYFGIKNDISVACCGNNFSSYHANLLLENGVEEIIIAFDKQYQQTNTEESYRWSKKLQQINEKYKNLTTLSFIWDTKDLLEYKASPTDMGKDVFMELFRERKVI